MTVGQFAEIAVMAILGMFIARFGFRRTIAIGAFAYFARYLIWGLISLQEPSGPSVDVSGQFIWTVPLVIGIFSQLLHGVCYACFFASAYMYVDKIADDDIRNSAQTVFGIIILGLGPMLAAPLLGFLANIFGEAGVVTDFAGMWLSLAAIAFITSAVFFVAFTEEAESSI